jgi:hypothetical protein
MANVTINPIPKVWHQYSERLWPRPAPNTFDGPPTLEDRELALALWRELDPRSKRWYVGYSSNPGVREFCGLPLNAADIDSMKSGIARQ